MKNLGLNIKNCREASGFSVYDIEKNLHIPHQTIYRWENSFNIPNVVDCARLADFFGVTIDYLVGREDDFGVIQSGTAEMPENERELLEVFRGLTDKGQKMVIAAAKNTAHYEKPENARAFESAIKK